MDRIEDRDNIEMIIKMIDHNKVLEKEDTEVFSLKVWYRGLKN